MVYGIIAILTIGCIFLGGRWFLIKKEIRLICEQMAELTDENTRSSLELSLIDRDLEKMVAQTNRLILKYTRQNFESSLKSEEVKQYISDISHDIRTPLTTVVGHIDLLEFTELNEKQRTYLKSMKESTIWMKELIYGFFEIARIYTQEIKFELTRINLANMIRESVLSFFDALSEKGVQPVLQVEDEDVFVYGEPEVTKKILDGVVSSCIERTRGDISIYIGNDIEEDIVLHFPVEQIDKIDPEKIFMRFYSKDEAKKRKTTVLALTMAKLYMVQMGGNILASKTEKELVFKLYFPKEGNGKKTGK